MSNIIFRSSWPLLEQFVSSSYFEKNIKENGVNCRRMCFRCHWLYYIREHLVVCDSETSSTRDCVHATTRVKRQKRLWKCEYMKITVAKLCQTLTSSSLKAKTLNIDGIFDISPHENNNTQPYFSPRHLPLVLAWKIGKKFNQFKLRLSVCWRNDWEKEESLTATPEEDTEECVILEHLQNLWVAATPSVVDLCALLLLLPLQT